MKSTIVWVRLFYKFISISFIKMMELSMRFLMLCFFFICKLIQKYYKSTVTQRSVVILQYLSFVRGYECAILRKMVNIGR